MPLPRWRRRWTRWLLIASLGLNLAAVGIIGGAILKGPPPPDPGPGPALWPFARALPQPYRSDLGEALRATRKDWSGPRETMSNLSRNMATALRADPFEPDAVRALFASQLDVANQLGARSTDLLMTQIDRMSPQDREAYAAELLERRGRKGPPGPPSKH
ncbi:putative membrane protein [Amaricoccus macauensis]|uniref:Putative membrane protein n=1 Tax=Amaricoccus macauensis TaxID=57001 RepID=A0A840SPH5_9RHOB|nr:periplasmic heavy metal sensor [Amaricoccus macauensis]MBB5221746.1 putative membrane protein [Amaricoccus macauensis]